MDEKEVQHILIEILYTAVNELENNESIKEKITPDILLAVYRQRRNGQPSFYAVIPRAIHTSRRFRCGFRHNDDHCNA